MKQRRVLFACDLDSQVFGALPLALSFAARGWRVGFAIDAGRMGGAVRERLSGRFEIIERSLGALAVQEDALGCDAIGVYATGSRVALFRHAAELAARVLGRPRPALFCGFNGLVLNRFEEGVAWRLGFDQICLNGPRDREAFSHFVTTTEFSGQPVVVTGLRRRTDAAPQPMKPQPGPGRRLFVFAEQVAAPADPRRRFELVTALARLAAASPGWDVAIKARVRPEEQTFHDQTRHVEKLVAKLPDRPANLFVSYEPLDDLLPRADLFGTISSTALFDALDNGVPSLLVADFGVRNAHGAHVVFGSGLSVKLGELASLDAAPRRAPDPQWLDRVGYGDQHSPDALIDRLEAFDPSVPLPNALYMFEEAAHGAAPSSAFARTIIASRNETEAAWAAGDCAAARAAIGRLGSAIERSDRQRAIDEAWRTREGRAARAARRFGLYGAYKRLRRRVVGEFPA
ncbi:DUF6716 putative glycosyltransferase [Hansschlegelia plantiphila]|uniref:Glycosyltransferase n=1 Tax=Hansschlegelia plantiphila TaxID=374655 RepID=A0A9W6IZ50_9HYPH|nr:DUF6716 putative glycosyltransferase [Hansschlegelia plantiphila]GLK67831.1 hypothetical protein GCM10008179_14690 [Hansschlegelia plantiphila]